MSPRRAAPGRRIGAGSLRVDAARAVMKLRDYQLPEPEMWILELLRAGVALGAESIRVEGDADDVRVSWAGAGPELDDLTTLLDELVNPASDPTRRHLRLMATAVNTALGLSPRYIDVVVISDGAAQRVRFTPQILEVDEDDPTSGAVRLRNLSAEAIARPPGAPDDGVVVHLRRFPDLGVLNTFVSGREPPELRLVRDSCDDSRVPITVGGGVLIRDKSDRDVLRVPMGPGVDGFMALTRATTRPDWARPAVFEACEQGVLLARHPVSLGFEVHAGVPIRISVDADRLPTNASRSEVRRGDAPIAQAEERAPKVFAALVKRLVRELGADAEGGWTERGREDLERAAFALLSSALSVGDFRARVPDILDGPLAPLTELPLLSDAFGRRRTLRDLSRSVSQSSFVYRGDEPLSEALEEWLSDLIWIPHGDPAELLVSHLTHADVGPRIRGAEHSLKARRRYLRYPVHAGKVPDVDGQVLSISLEGLSEGLHGLDSGLSPGFFLGAALDGELCLTSPLGRAMVSYLHDGRLLARRKIDSPIAFDAVVSSEKLTPTADFSGLFDDEGAAAVDTALMGAAIVAAEALARRALGEKGQTGTARRRWVRSRAKVRKSPETHAILRSAIDARHRLIGESTLTGPLQRAPAWPIATFSGERHWVSIDALRRGNELGRFFSTGPGAVSRANPGLPEGRLVVAGTTAELEVLARHLPSAVPIIHYYPAELTIARDAETLAKELASLTGAALTFEGAEGFGAIGFAMQRSEVDVRHRGQSLEKRAPQDVAGPCWILYEGTNLIPRPDRRGVAAGSVPEHFSRHELALVRAIAGYVLDDTVDGFFVVPDVFEKQIVPLLIERLAVMGVQKALGAKLRKRFFALPLFSVVGRPEPVSLVDLAELHPGSLRWIPMEQTFRFDVGDFHPLRAPERLAKAIAAILTKETKSAVGEIERRRKKAIRQERLAAHREQVAVAEPSIDGDPRTVDVPAGAPNTPRVRLTLPAHHTAGSLTVLVDDRVFTEVPLREGPPLRGVARLRAPATDATFEQLTEKSRERLVRLAHDGVPKLLASVAKAEPDALRTEIGARNLLDWWLANRRDSDAADLGDDVEALGHAQLFDTVQGDKAGALDALRRTQIYVASYVGMWIGPDEGEASHSLDRPVIRVNEGAEGKRQVELIAGLTGQKVADVTRACEQLQARRRVAQGLVPKPTLHGHSGVSHVHDVAALVGNDRVLRSVLGPGEIGLHDGSQSRVFIQRAGRYVGAVDVNVSPTVLVTLESPDVPRDLNKVKKGTKLRRRVQELTDKLVRRLVADGGEGLLTAVEKRRFRSAMLAGEVLADYDATEELALFETTAGLWFSKAELRRQYERFADVWYVPDLRSEEVALDEERHVFRMSHDDGTYMLGDVMLLVDATEELRLDAEARVNRQRRPVESIELEYGEQRAAVGYEILKVKGKKTIEGIVAPLRPGTHAHRGMRLSRGRHPLGDHRDPCSWPTRAVIDAPEVEPDRTWSGADETHPSYEEVKKAVRRASEKAIRGLVDIPANALEPRRVDSAVCRRAVVEVPVRGALWATKKVGAGSVRVIDRGGVRVLRHSVERPPLPIEGTLFVDAGATSSAAEDVAEVVYKRMLMSLSKRLANAWIPVMAAHVIHGLATRVVTVGDLPGKHEWPLGVSRPIDPATVQAWLDGSAGVVWVVKADEVEDAKRIFSKGAGGPTDDNPWLIDDDSLAARALMLHLDWRAQRWPPKASPSAVVPAPPVSPAPGPEDAAPLSLDEIVGSIEASAASLPDLDDYVDVSDTVPDVLFVDAPPVMDVAHFVRKSLTSTSVNATVQVTPSSRRSILARDGSRYQFAGRNPAVAAVQSALDQKDPRAQAAIAVLTARVIGEANRVHEDVTDEQELDALTTLLGTRVPT